MLALLVGVAVVTAGVGERASPPPGKSEWLPLGPTNIFDDASGESGGGESGTLADAASPIANPNIIYTGGMNNGASSGILKSTDMGKTWTKSSVGLFDTRISGVYVLQKDSQGSPDPQGKHVYAATPSGIYESVDGAASWTLIEETVAFGSAHSFHNGTIMGDEYIFAGTSRGIANIPVKGGKWNLIPSPKGDWHTPMSVAEDGRTSTVVGCNAGIVYLGDVENTTSASWTTFPKMTCWTASMDPNNRNRFVYSDPKAGASNVKEVTARYQEVGLELPSKTWAFYVAIDRQGWIYTGAEAGAFRSTDGGKSWEPYVVKMVARSGFVNNRVPHDYQRISLDFAGGVAFPSDQGLFIKPAGNSTTLIAANGDMCNNIAIKLAVSAGDGSPGGRSLITTVWDWNVLASWNDGKNWPSTPGAPWNSPTSSAGSPGAIGEGGAAYGMGTSNHVLIMHYHNIYYSSEGGKNMTRTEIPDNANCHSSAVVYTNKAGERGEPAGPVYTIIRKDVTPGQNRTAARLREHQGDDDDDDGSLRYMSYGEQRDECGKDHDGQNDPYCIDPDRATGPEIQSNYVLKSMNFGRNWTWTILPKFLQDATLMSVDPTDPTKLYIISSNCISISKDQGETWEPCLKATGLTGIFTSLMIKDSNTMVLLRNGDVPLRTKDGAKTWQPLTSAAAISAKGVIGSGEYSWSGKTLVIHGRDNSAPSRGEYAGYVWKSTDDGDTWTDETGDLVTMAVNSGTWFDKDWYLNTSGEGILVKRNFEA